MSVSARVDQPGLRFSRTPQRVLVALAALAGAALVLALLGTAASALLGTPAVPPPRNPFGTGLREAAPGATGLGGWILAVQGEFYRGLTGALAAARREGGAPSWLVGIGFLYGVFHAAGPGHGKGVIAGYLLATKRTLAKGLGLSFAAALVQAGVAIGLVVVLAAVLKLGAPGINAAAGWVETASFAGLLAVGTALLWRKTAGVVSPAHSHGVAGGRAHHHGGGDHAGHGPDSHGHGHGHATGESCAACGHVHIPPPAALERAGSWRESAGIVLAAGIRPCSGAIILLVFALSQGLFGAGILAVLAMGLGTAVTTGALAALAVLAKNAAIRLTRGQGRTGEILVGWLEVAAAAFVAALGGALLLGALSGHGLS